MGVLKALVGGVWTKVGCGGAAATTPVYPSAANTVTFYVDTSTFEIWCYANAIPHPLTTQLDCDIDAHHFIMGMVGGTLAGHSLWYHAAIPGVGPGDTINYALHRDASDNYLGESSWDPSTVQPLVTATVGRLRLWTGSGWVREACDHDVDASGYTSSADIGWNTGTSPDPAGEWTGGYQMQPQLLQTMPSGSYYEVRQRPVNTVTGARGAWTQAYANFGPFSITTWTYPHDFLGYFQGGSPFGTDEVLGDVEVRYATATSASGDGALLATWHHGVSPAHPLKIEDPDNPGTWITVACMVPV